jgi:hypothetical protein
LQYDLAKDKYDYLNKEQITSRLKPHNVPHTEKGARGEKERQGGRGENVTRAEGELLIAVRLGRVVSGLWDVMIT